MTQINRLVTVPEIDASKAEAGADQVARAFERMGDAAVISDQRVTRATASFDAIERRAVRFGETTEAAVRRIELATQAHTRSIAAAEEAARREGVTQERLATTISQFDPREGSGRVAGRAGSVGGAPRGGVGC